MAEPVLNRVPPAGPVALLMDAAALEAWAAARTGRLQRAGRPWQLLRLQARLNPAATGATAAAGDPGAATQALLMTACAHRLRSRVRATDHVARVGDAGFAVLLDGAAPAGARAAAARLVPLCEGPYCIGDQRWWLTVSLQAERALSLVPPASPAA